MLSTIACTEIDIIVGATTFFLLLELQLYSGWLLAA
jgi:hypothetical protein